jgi:hypothetical protein
MDCRSTKNGKYGDRSELDYVQQGPGKQMEGQDDMVALGNHVISQIFTV